jgi:hypothetical protein
MTDDELYDRLGELNIIDQYDIGIELIRGADISDTLKTEHLRYWRMWKLLNNTNLKLM